MREFQDMFRPNYDLAASAAWLASIIALVLTRPVGWPIFLIFALVMFAFRTVQMLELYKFRISISSIRLTFMPIDDVVKKCTAIANKRKSFWLGTGFVWSQKHAETARQIVYRNPGEITDLPLPVKRIIESAANIHKDKRNAIQRAIIQAYGYLQPKDSIAPSDGAIGVPWIHGIGETEEDIVLPLDAMTGHTQILGTTRAGKTRFYEILSTQVIHSGSTLIVFDPKKDADWIARLKKECARKGRKFLYFDMARPEISIRMDPLSAWNNLTEIATRISQLIDAEGTFAAFSWKTLHIVQRGMVAAGIKPNIRNTREIILMGAEGLTESVIDTYFLQKLGAGWDRDIDKAPKNNGKASKDPLPEELIKKINFYRHQPLKDDSIDGLISMVEHDRSHYTKLRETLIPILEMLGSGEIGKLLSPDAADIEDDREIWTIKKIIEEKAVLYVGLDSLSNSTVASAIGSILLADLASTAGQIYNFQKASPTYVVIDESSEVLNAQVTQILNKGGGADFRCFVASQSISDYTVRYGTKDKAMQAMASLNNLICFRIKDPEAAKLASDMFGVTQARDISTSMSTGAESMTNATEFRTQTSRSLNAVEIPLVSPHLLTRLPPLHFFSFIAGRSVSKGRLHLIQD